MTRVSGFSNHDLGPGGRGFESRRPDYISQAVSTFSEIAALGLNPEHLSLLLERHLAVDASEVVIVMLFVDSVSLPRTLAAWQARSAGADIDDVLAKELNEQAAHILSGYNSDDEEIEILNLTTQEGRLNARFAIRFDEVIPSGCRDHPRREERRVELVLQMDTDSDQAILGGDESNPDEWELWNRNSAADGT